MHVNGGRVCCKRHRHQRQLLCAPTVPTLFSEEEGGFFFYDRTRVCVSVWREGFLSRQLSHFRTALLVLLFKG